MEHLAVGLVLLAGTLGSGNPVQQRGLAAAQVLLLDMAPASFDDQYQGCSQLMEEELEELNRTEFSTNGVYAQAWALATEEWRSRRGRVPLAPPLRQEHAVALLAYTQQSSLYRAFNAAVRVAGRSREDYLASFHFKVLHFLLTKALSILRDQQPQPAPCHHVYWGVQGIYFTARQGERVRFGYFTSASLQNKSAVAFGRDTLFSVETCYGVPIKDFSFYPEEEEVLIPPFEVFEVTEVAQHGDRTFIQLRYEDTSSSYNCVFVKEKRCKIRPCVFNAARSIHGDSSHLWVLLATMVLASTKGP